MALMRGPTPYQVGLTILIVAILAVETWGQRVPSRNSGEDYVFSLSGDRRQRNLLEQLAFRGRPHHEPNAATCTSSSYTKGHWQNAPCGISRNVGIGSKYDRIHLAENCRPRDKETVPRGNCRDSSCDWIIAGNCKLLPFEMDGFCKGLAGRSILFVGDSITALQFHALRSLTKARLKSGEGKISAATFLAGEPYNICNNESSIAFVKNNNLAPVPANQWRRYTSSIKEHTKSYFNTRNCYPWVDMLKDYEILVLNTGIHLAGRTDTVYEEELADALSYVHDNYDGQTYYRLTVPGHPGCQNATESPVSSYEYYLERYHGGQTPPYGWERVPTINAIERRLAVKFNVPVLDVVSMTEVRPDSHVMGAKGDCLHYVLPSVVDHWNWLLYNAIIGRIS